jgi:hypothetical protein
MISPFTQGKYKGDGGIPPPNIRQTKVELKKILVDR